MATKKSATPQDEKFTDQDFDLFKAIDAIDAKNYGWFSKLTPEQKRKFVPYMMAHWISSVKKGGAVSAYYLMSVDATANKYLFDEKIQDHPELQWLMLCAASPGIGKQFHSWIPHLNNAVCNLREPASKKEVRDYFSKIYKIDAAVLDEISSEFAETQRHQHKLAKMFPHMKLEDVKLLGDCVTEQDIEDYEKDSGN
jgi:hypothetical protein